MSWMHNNIVAFLRPNYDYYENWIYHPWCKTSLPEFALFIKFIISYKQRQMGHIFIRLFPIIFRRTISCRSRSHKLRNTLYNNFFFTGGGYNLYKDRLIKLDVRHTVSSKRWKTDGRKRRAPRWGGNRNPWNAEKSAGINRGGKSVGNRGR